MRNVIIIDDEISIIKLLKSILEDLNYKVHSFTSAEQFFNARKNLPECLYLVDAGLPGLQGEDVIKSIRFSDKIAPVFMLSGKLDKENISRGLMAGADDFISKPPDLDVLVQKITNAFNKVSFIHERIKDGEVKRNSRQSSLSRDEVVVKLTAAQYNIICSLLDSETRKKSREELIREMGNSELDVRTVDVHIHAIRKKVALIGIVIDPIRGYGYQISIVDSKS